MSDVSIQGIDPKLVASDKGMTAEDYFRKNYGYESWLLDIPEVHDALIPVLEERGDPGKVQAAIEGTSWFQTHSDAQRKFIALQGSNKNEAESQVQTKLADVVLSAQKMGLQLDDARARQIATDAAMWGWSPNQLTLSLQHEAQKQPGFTTTSDTQRQFVQDMTNNPGQVHAAITQMEATIAEQARRSGITLDPAHLSTLAWGATYNGWSTAQIDQQLQSELDKSNGAVTTSATGNIAASTQQVKQMASKYFMSMDDTTAQNMGRNIANGTSTLQGVQTWLISQASRDRPELAAQLAQGHTMDDLFSTHRMQIAQTLETDPSQIDFVNNPTWKKVTDFVPPGETQRRAMTVPEALTFARSQPDFKHTNQANQLAAEQVQAIAKTFGKMA